MSTTVPDWWLVAITKVDEAGCIVRLAFRDRPVTNVWVPGAQPPPAQIERLALMVLYPPPPASKPDIQH